MQFAPTIRNAVPWKAVSIRKMKNETRFGDKAVPTENPRNMTADIRHGHLLP
jgi:hypothetical protein